jgi:tetratricopeptide (TPR) repeat protein
LEIDPDSVVALIVEGRALQVVGTIREAESRYEKAVALNRRLVDLLATQPLTDSWVLRDVMARAPSGAAAPETAADEGLERWLAGAKEDRNKRYERLRLKGNWQKMARGEIQAATDDLEDVVDTAPAGEQQFRLAALGQLAILQWQAGNPHRAEQYQERIEAFLAESENPVTRENYRKLRRVLRQRGVQLVAVQYPMRRLEPLKRLLGSAPEVVFVDNEQIFERALLGRPHAEIFHDLFAGNFGHMTPLGNRLLAENVADTILALVAERGAG